MTKTLTEQWREGTLPDGKYYIKLEPNFTESYDVGYSEGGDFALYNIEDIEEVLAPVPDYGSLYNPNDGRIPVGLFTVLKLIKRDIERWQTTRHLTDLECGIKSQVVSLLKRRGWDLGKDGLVNNPDKHIEPIKKIEQLETKCSQLEKRLEIATKALTRYSITDTNGWVDSQVVARKALKEMESVK